MKVQQQPNSQFVQQQPNGQFVQQSVESQLIFSPPVSQSTSMAQSFNRIPITNSLPKDLENLKAFMPPDCDLQDIDEIIKEELAATSNSFNFDF